MKKIKAAVLIGPTGAGKTELSLKIAEEKFQIISSDSVQIYRYLDIGSCKPTEKQRETVKHYLIDIVDPDYRFTAGDFCREAAKACDKIKQQNRYPLFVGGCAFYVNAFFKGLSDIPEVPDQIRDGLKIELEERGLPSLYNELKECDPAFALAIHPNDKQRVLRGLEVYRETGKPISSFFSRGRTSRNMETLFAGIHIGRDDLRQRIHNRVDELMKAGFLDEVIRLREMGYSAELNSMRSIGYRELNAYLDGHVSLNDAVEKIKTETGKYAKRQMTWYKKNSGIHWYTVAEFNKIKELLYNWIDGKNI